MVGPVSGHLLITDARGRRLGFLHGRFVAQIPGARVVNLFVGGPRTWLAHTEPEYRMPVGQRYRIDLTGQSAGRRAQRSRSSVTVIEPGFLAAVRKINTQTGRQDRISLSADGHAISYRPGASGEQTPELVLGAAEPGNDHQWNITDLGTPSGEQVSASLDLARGNLSINGAGHYDLSMDLVGNGTDVFDHDNLAVGAGATAQIDYAHWSEGQTMPATYTQDGVVQGQQSVIDQASPSDTGAEFAPTEPTPAPPEPQPQPQSPGATATTLVCSPGAVAVDATTACKVDVSDVSSSASSTPTGDVQFSSDGSGSFSASSCTLSDGSCEVTYTPSAIGSGTHNLTASYRGGQTYTPSTNLTAETVTTRSTGTSLFCSPQDVAVGEQTTCTVTVTDTDAGAKSTPTGTVSFGSDSPGTFVGNPCTLSGNGASASCSVTYTPSEASGTHVIGATYSGDPTHAGSG